MANPDYDALNEIFRDYKEEFVEPGGYEPEHFLDWTARQIGLTTDLNSLIALYERRLTELKDLRLKGRRRRR